MKVIPGRFVTRWRRYWAWRADLGGFGRLAAWLAALDTPPYHGRAFLSRYHRRGFVAHSASLDHPRLKLGERVFIGDNVRVSSGQDAGEIELRDRVQIYGDMFMHTSLGGRITVDEGTHIQPSCRLHACLADITIGKKVEIAAGCAFYSYDHGVEPGTLIMDQLCKTKGPITVGDGAWLGHGVIVLSGVSIGAGAVIGAGSVVTSDIPDGSIAVGNPARVIRFRDRAQRSSDKGPVSA